MYRHMFADYPPDRENTLGARWNPPKVPAIYTSLDRATVIAEAEYQISLEPLRPRARRTVYQVEVALSATLDLSAPGAPSGLGISSHDLAGMDHTVCQVIGGAAEHLDHDGLFVPSARASGINLVIYPNRQTVSYRFEVRSAEVIYEP